MRYRFAVMTVIALALYAGQFSSQEARGSDHAGEYEVHEEDWARQALERGEILPLDRVIGRLRDSVPGEVSGLELEKENGIWIYEFKVISPAGQMITVRMNAKTGALAGKARE